MAEFRAVEHYAGEEGAQGEGDIKQLGGARGDPEAMAGTAGVKSSREPVAALRANSGDRLAATIGIRATKATAAGHGDFA